MSELYESLAHSKWNCKYHVVFVPKRRRKAIFGQTRRQLGAIFHALARQKECQIIEGHLMPDHVHICIAIPPKHPVASVIGFLKGKSAIAIARLCGKERNFTGELLWARGYAVSTVGFELEQVQQYIRDQAAAKLAANLLGESPTGGTFPVAPVVIPGDGEGDRSVGSPGVKVLAAGRKPGRLRQKGEQAGRS
jgi:putative transposase